MITSRQVRAARALLGWTQELLADKALVALTALKRLESDRRPSATRHGVPCGGRSRPQTSCCYRPAAARGSCWSDGRQDNPTKRLDQARTTVVGRRH